MKTLFRSGLCGVAILVIAATATRGKQDASSKRLSAPTYYIVAVVNDCEPEPNYVAFRGASNLPVGAIITAAVTDFDFDAWKYFSDEVSVPVDEQGFFSGEISPKKGMKLRHNLILRVDFSTNFHNQPASVLEVVGRKGEKLDIAGRSPNPQLYQVSGWYYGLETIARVPHCGEVP